MSLKKSEPFYKVALFSSQSFQEYSGPKFLGPELVVAIAYHGDSQYFSFCEIPAQLKENRIKSNELIVNTIMELKEKLPSDWKLKAILTHHQGFEDLKIESKKVLLIPEKSLPSDFLDANQIAKNIFQTKFDFIKKEHPQLPLFEKEISDHLEALSQFPYLKKFYNFEDPHLKESWEQLHRKKKMLLHICCGPDAAGVIQQLKEEFDLICFWYDPNIQPKSEHDLRLEAFVKVAEREKVPYIVGEYDVDHFLQRIKGLEHTPEQGAKCSHCYDMRLERSALEAQKESCDLYSTTLAISPHKVQQKLKNYGELFALKYKVPYYARNFMKEDGFKESVKYTKTWDIYRQDYCGCWYSLYEGGSRARKMADEYGFTEKAMKNRSFPPAPSEDS